jgi:hypothetical protein
MTTRKPNERESRAILAGMAIILALITGFRAAPAWNTWRKEVRELATVLTIEAAHTSEMYDAFPMVLDSLEARVAKLRELHPAPLVTRNMQEAGTTLVSLVETAARAASVQTTAIKVAVDTSKTAALPRIMVAFDGTGDIISLAAFLSGLEAAPVALAIRSISIVPHNVETQAHEIELLAIRIKVEALALRRELQETDGQ